MTDGAWAWIIHRHLPKEEIKVYTLHSCIRNRRSCLCMLACLDARNQKKFCLWNPCMGSFLVQNTKTWQYACTRACAILTFTVTVCFCKLQLHIFLFILAGRLHKPITQTRSHVYPVTKVSHYALMQKFAYTMKRPLRPIQHAHTDSNAFKVGDMRHVDEHTYACTQKTRHSHA